jgi:Family of unknown function (DUF6494)
MQTPASELKRLHRCHLAPLRPGGEYPLPPQLAPNSNRPAAAPQDTTTIIHATPKWVTAAVASGSTQLRMLSSSPVSALILFGRIAMDEDRFNIALRKFLKVVGITSQREIERVVREGKVEGTELKLQMTLTAENAPLNHIVEETIDLR